MEQSPSWEVNRFSASQDTSRILWKPKVFLIAITKVRHLSLSLARSIPSMPPPPRSHFLMIYLNIVLPSKTVPSKCSVSLRFPHENPVWTSPLPRTCYMLRPPQSFRFDHPNNIWWGYRSWSWLCLRIKYRLTCTHKQWRTQEFFSEGGGSTNSVEDRENGDLGAVAP